LGTYYDPGVEEAFLILIVGAVYDPHQEPRGRYWCARPKAWQANDPPVPLNKVASGRTIGASSAQVTKYLPITYSLKEAEMLFNPREKGQGLVEYALILVLVSVVVIAILTLLGPAIGNVFSEIKNNFG
jgi:pilus assembly protein Flp/PilA